MIFKILNFLNPSINVVCSEVSYVEKSGWFPIVSLKLPRKSDLQPCTFVFENERVIVPSGQKFFNPETTKVAVVVDASYRYAKKFSEFYRC